MQVGQKRGHQSAVLPGNGTGRFCEIKEHVRSTSFFLLSDGGYKDSDIRFNTCLRSVQLVLRVM
ncbi:hypothetical protein EU527_01120 [Candidatus Thorarchaeota archaeon]|nr:MAG: hypothetical protein EU527_01120 [Candidatus Thorarchaeota archaeon]